MGVSNVKQKTLGDSNIAQKALGDSNVAQKALGDSDVEQKALGDLIAKLFQGEKSKFCGFPSRSELFYVFNIFFRVAADARLGVQIEGAFMQGMGWSTIEEVVWGDKDHPWVRPGHLFTKGPGPLPPAAPSQLPPDSLPPGPPVPGPL